MVALPTGDGELFAGFRGESLSLYFGQDLVFHFNDGGELRRAFVADELLKADGGRLLAMRRERSEWESLLVSRALGEVESQSLLNDLELRLRELAESLMANRYRVVGEVPANGGVVGRLGDWLAARSGSIIVAASPHVG